MTENEFVFMDPGHLRDSELELVLDSCLPVIPSRGWSPAYCFSMRVNGAIIGNINLRIGDTPLILLYAGHIGYSVIPDYRGHHYAERASRLLFPLAERHGMSELWITCNPDNIPSRRTCERLGGQLVEIVALPMDNEMYRIGEREKCRYRVPLSSLVSRS